MKKIKLLHTLLVLLICNTGLYAQYTVGNGSGFAYANVGAWEHEVPLPIELLCFTAECSPPNIIIEWATASEINNDYFTVERSFDGVNFDILGTLAGAGNSSQIQYYSFIDNKPFDGISYYRLKQTDFDGKYEYFNIIAANCRNEFFGDIKVYPNPVINELTIEMAGNNKPVKFEIIDLTGKVVYKESFVQKTTVLTSTFMPGSYLVRFESGNISELKKIIIK